MAILDFPNEHPGGGALQAGDTYTGDNGVLYTYDGVKWVGRSLSSFPPSSTGDWRFNTVTATTDGNIIVKAGANADSWASLLSNDGDNSFWVDNAGAHVTTDFSGSENYWTFGRDGTLKIPNSDTQITEQGIVNTSSYVALVSSGPTGAAALEWISDINEGTSTKIAIVTANSPFSATSGTVQIVTGGFIFNGETTVPENVWDFGTDGNLTLPKGSTISETVDTTVITPPGGSAGQGLVIRPTGGTPITVTVDHPDGFVPGESITITFSTPSPTSGYVALSWIITGPTPEQIGTPPNSQYYEPYQETTGTIWASDTGTVSLTWVIPEGSDMTSFTLGWTTNLAGGASGSVTISLDGHAIEEHGHLHLVAGNPTNYDLYLGDDDQYVKIERNAGNVVIGTNTNTNQWTFGTDGNLTTHGDIQDSNGSLIFVATTSTAPTRVDGLVWFNTVDGRAYIKYENNWVDLSPSLVPPVSTYLDGLAIDGTTISTIDSTATMYMGGDLLPEYNNMYDLGSAERQWKSLYVSTSTIYIGGTALSVDSAGNLLVDGSPIQAGSTALGDRLTTGSYSVVLGTDGTLTLPNGSTIGSSNGFSGIPMTTARGTVLFGNQPECVPTGASHFHIMKDDPYNVDLFLGDDANYVKLPSTTGVEIGAGASEIWSFSSDGSMTFPDGSKQTTAYLGVDNNRWLDYMQADTGGYSIVVGVTSVQHDSQNSVVASVYHYAMGYNYTGIVKVDAEGSTEWERIYTTSTQVNGWGVAVDSHDDIYVAGNISGSLGNVWLAKLDGTTGESMWQTGLDGFEGYVVDVGPDDCPVVVGTDWYNNKDMFVTKFSSTGTILWQHELGDSVYNDSAWGMAVGPDNEIIVVGTTNHDGGSGSNLLLVAKYTVGGILLWQKEIYESNWSGWNANGADAVVDSSGNIYVLFSQTTVPGAYAILMKISSDGETIDWNITLAANCVNQYTASLDVDTDGNVYLNSVTLDFNGAIPVYNTFVSSISSTGNIRWQRALSRQLATTPNGSATLTYAGASTNLFGNPIDGSSLSVRNGKIAIGGGSINILDFIASPNPDYNTALGYIFQTTTDGDVFARGEWELVNTYFDVGSTTLTVNTGTCSTDARVMNIISIDIPSVPGNQALNIQRLREPVERIGTGANFDYSTVQEGLSFVPGAVGVTSITGNHDTNTGVGLTSENWAQLMWVPDTSVVTVDDISNGPDVYNWAYVDDHGFHITNHVNTGTGYEWTFDTDGKLIMPPGNETQAGWIQWSHANNDSETNVAGIGFVDHYNVYTGLGLVAPTDTNAAKGIWFGTPTDPNSPFMPDTSMVFRGDTLYLPKNGYIKSHDYDESSGYPELGYTGTSITIQTAETTSTQHNWIFGVDGELTLPTNGRLGAIDPKGGTMLDGGLGANVSLTSFYSTGNYSSCVTASAGGQLYITAYNDGGPNPSRQWIFDKDGSLTLPEGGVIKNSTGTNILDGLGGGAANIGNYTFNSDNLNMPLTAKLNSGGVGVANSAEFGTSVTVSTSTVVNSEIYMGSGYGEFRSIYNKVGATESGLTYAGVEGFNYAQYGDVNFSGMVSQTPYIDSMYTISVSTTTGQISIGFTQDGGTSVSKDWITVLGTLNAYYTVNGIFADTTQTVIAGGDGVLSSIVKLTDSVNITTIDSITTSTQTWSFDSSGNLTLPEGGTVKGGGTGTDVTVVAGTGTNNKIWTFAADGGLTFPDTTVQTTAWRGLSNAGSQTLGGRLYLDGKKLSDGPYEANSIEMGASLGLSAVRGIGGNTGGIVLQTGAGYTVEHAWQFGYDGKLTLPDGGTLRMSTAPISSTGTVGDIAGTIAVNTASIFYCIADFVLNTGTYSVVTTDSNNGSVFFIEVAKGSYPQPQIGWDVSISGNLSHIDDTPTDLGTSWRISVSAVTAYSTGTTIILTNPSPSQPDIWVKQAWGTTGSW